MSKEKEDARRKAVPTNRRQASNSFYHESTSLPLSINGPCASQQNLNALAQQNSFLSNARVRDWNTYEPPSTYALQERNNENAHRGFDKIQRSYRKQAQQRQTAVHQEVFDATSTGSMMQPEVRHPTVNISHVR